MYNNISRYDEKGLWIHKELVALAIHSNSIKLPVSGIHMPSLTFLHLADNNATIHKQFNKNSLPSIIDLYMNGNIVKAFPSETLKDTIVYLGVARCNLKSLPSYLSTFENLLYIDARDNKIA